jgi:hypothetical protein
LQPPPARPQRAEILAEAPAAPTASARTEGQVSTDCLPEGLKMVLADLSAKFGSVTVVSTDHLHTDNHSPGSIREKLHLACRAVDFKAEKSVIPEITAYLRSRREVSGVNSYRNGIVHMDSSEGGQTAARPAPTRSSARRAVARDSEPEAEAPLAAAQPAEAVQRANPFAPAPPPDPGR